MLIVIKIDYKLTNDFEKKTRIRGLSMGASKY